MPLRFLVKAAITVVTPPVVFIVFRYTRHTTVFFFAVRRNHSDVTALQLRFDGGATAIIRGMTAVFAAALRGY